MTNQAPTSFLLGGDMPVQRLGFGAMRLAANGFTGPARDAETSRAVLRCAVELGINLIDTAQFYRSSDGSLTANNLIREALHPYRDGLVIATKVGPIVGPSGFSHGKADDMRRLVEENLQSLGLDRLDLVYLRIGSMEPPHGESLAERFEALAALRQEGVIRHLGLSNIDVDHLAEAQAIAPVVAVQNNFHIGKRDEMDLLDACTRQGIAFAPFYPLGGGAGELGTEAMATVAKRHGATPSQIALAWLLARSPVILAIPGTGSIKHLEENAAAGAIQLTERDLAELGWRPCAQSSGWLR